MTLTAAERNEVKSLCSRPGCYCWARTPGGTCENCMVPVPRDLIELKKRMEAEDD